MKALRPRPSPVCRAGARSQAARSDLILCALGSGYLWAFLQNLPLLPGDYFRQLAQALNWLDFALLAVKSCLFGFIIALVTC